MSHARRVSRYGPNVLPAAAGKSALQRFIAQFDNVLIYVPLGLSLVTALLGRGVDTAVIKHRFRASLAAKNRPALTGINGLLCVDVIIG